jgi:molybdopterin biosynthesis enzyme
MVDDSSIQRISRLTPLDTVLALIESKVTPVKPQTWRVIGTYGRTLAEEAVATERPTQPIALRDGFAVEAAAVRDAGPYAPLVLQPPSCRIEVGEPLPAGTDAVLPLDAVVFRGNRVEAVASVAPGDGVLAAGGDTSSATPLRRAGAQVRTLDLAVMRAAGVEGVSVREPRIAVVYGGRPGPALTAATANLNSLVADAGGNIRGRLYTLEEALANLESDAIVSVGGTGSGPSDGAVNMLARRGYVEVRGIAISPGETAAFGFADARPVLLLPGRVDATFAVWMLIGRHLVAKLAGGSVAGMPVLLPLKRKVTSTIGLTELIPVACAGGMAEPLASGYLSLTALARSDGWIVIPPDSEGFGAGTPVAVRPWP